MTSFHKKSFFLQFVLYFSIALILLGLVQSIFGTLRLYNASEESYEKLAPEKVYTVSKNTAIMPEKTIEKNDTQDTPYSVAENNKNPEKNPEKVTSTNTQKIEENNTVQQYVKQVGTEKKEATKKPSVPPVEISVTPKENPEPKGYRETILTVVMGKYFRDALWKFPIIIDTERVEPRGQMYNESITLGSQMTNLPELSKVLVHEIGHMIDIYTFRKNLKKADVSEEFYKISWQNPTTIKAGVPQASFVSGYASTNQYEDFAESFTMYIFHNREFLNRAQHNDYLKQKYYFLRTRVFGDAFLFSAHEQKPVPKKVWDVTKIAIRGNNIETIFAWINTLTHYKS